MELGSLKLHFEKVWKVYIEKHLFEGLIKRSFFNLKQHIYYAHYNTMVFDMSKLRYLPEESTYYKNITRTSGQIYVKYTKRTIYVMSLFFYLNYNLTMNITFLKIGLHGPTVNCLYHYDSVKITTHVWPQSRTITLYRFCGFHSKFNFYSKLNHYIIEAEADIAAAKIFEIHFKFSVIDKGVIYTIQDNVLKNYTMKEDFQLLPYHSYATTIHNIKSYIVTIRKMYNIILKQKVPTFIVRIFDGPGFMYESYLLQKEITRTTGFSCLIQVLNSSVNTVANGSVDFRLVHAHVNLLYHVDNNVTQSKIKMPISSCLTHICIVLMEASIGYHVNLTIQKISNIVEYNYDCLEGGILTAEEVQGTYVESVTLCEVHDGIRRQSRSFYSMNSSLHLIYYWYNMSSRMETLISFTETKCETVHLDPCAYSLLHCWSMTRAQIYLNNITKFSKLSLITNDFIPSRLEYLFIIFEVPKNQCATIQIGNRNIQNTPIFHKHMSACGAWSCNFIISPISDQCTISRISGYFPADESIYDAINTHVELYDLNYRAITLPFLAISRNQTLQKANKNGFQLTSAYTSLFYYVLFDKQTLGTWIDIFLDSNELILNPNRFRYKLQQGIIDNFMMVHHGLTDYALADFMVQVLETKSSSESALQVYITLLISKGISIAYGQKYIPQGTIFQSYN